MRLQYHLSIRKGKLTTLKARKKFGWRRLGLGRINDQASLVLCVFADGVQRVSPMVIFRGGGKWLRAERAKYHPRVLIEFNPTTYMNNRLFEGYIKEHLIPVLGCRPTLYALDLMGSHTTPVILDLLRSNNITPSLIPRGCTGLVPPLDVSVNKPFKELVRELTDEKIFKLELIDQFEKWVVGDWWVV